MKFIGLPQVYHHQQHIIIITCTAPLSLQTQTFSSSAVGVSCSLSLSRCLQKVGWSINVYEENPAPFCSRN